MPFHAPVVSFSKWWIELLWLFIQIHFRTLRAAKVNLNRYGGFCWLSRDQSIWQTVITSPRGLRNDSILWLKGMYSVYQMVSYTTWHFRLKMTIFRRWYCNPMPFSKFANISLQSFNDKLFTLRYNQIVKWTWSFHLHS